MRGSIRTRLLVAFLFVAVTAAAGLSVYFLNEVEAYGLRRLEERLDTEARVSSGLLGAAIEAGTKSGATPKLSRPLDEALGTALTEAGKQTTSRLVVVDAKGVVVADSTGTAPAGPDNQTTRRLVVVDAKGVVVADSTGTSAVGSDYSGRPEIAKALAGGYGAMTRRLASGRVALYVAAPIRAGSRIAGATYAASSTFSILTLLSDYRRQLLLVVVAFGLGALVLTELLSRWLTRPLRELQGGAAALAGDHSVRVRPTGPRETYELAIAFNDLAEEIETSSIELHEEERRKSRFVSDVSHELRTPLTAIRGAAETLMDEGVSAEDQRRFLGRIVSESDRLKRLADDLISLQRIEGATGELPLARVDLAQTARIAVEALEPVAADRGVLVSVEGASPAVLGDRDRLQQVIQNLVDNATRVTPAGARVTVRLSGTPAEAVLEVLDEGPGIPPADLASLFERFYRAQYSRDRATGGAGLGLAIVKAIVTAHRGEIDAANRPEGGAVFTVRLPALKALKD